LLGIPNLWPKDRLLVSENLIIYFCLILFDVFSFGIRDPILAENPEIWCVEFEEK
jgi:hypothetical protein